REVLRNQRQAKLPVTVTHQCRRRAGRLRDLGRIRIHRIIAAPDEDETAHDADTQQGAHEEPPEEAEEKKAGLIRRQQPVASSHRPLPWSHPGRNEQGRAPSNADAARPPCFRRTRARAQAQARDPARLTGTGYRSASATARAPPTASSADCRRAYRS